MNFNNHSNLIGRHAFMSPSKFHWINYDLDKLVNSYMNYRAAQNGTELHDIASKLIQKKIRLPDENKTFNLYVNDAIEFNMTPEQGLWYSENCFGVADAIAFDGHTLRIHDLKTGSSLTHMEQLMIYAALFCLEYRVSPFDISIILQIYQNDEVLVYEPLPEDIQTIMDTIVKDDKCINNIKTEA